MTRHRSINERLKGLLIICGCVLATLLPPVSYATHRTGDFPLPGLMAVGDFNQDGKLDLAVHVEGFDNVAILTGDGMGGFTLKSHLKTDTLPKGLDVGDVNSDGHLDLVSITKWGYNIRLYLGDGAGGFSFAKELIGDGEPNRVLLRDMNKDGKLDIVAVADMEQKVVIFFGDGRGGFSPSPLELDTTHNDFAIATGDFNNDGNIDFVVTEYNNENPVESDFAVFLGDGAGKFNQSGTFTTNIQPSTIAVSDLNKDGNLDVVVGGAGADNDTGLFLSTYLGDGHGSFTLQQANDLGTGSIKGEITIGDFNEDGNPDVAFPQSSKLTIRGDLSTTVLTFLGDGTGQLTSGPDLTVGKEPDTAVASDLNKDGHIDLVVSNRTDHTVSVLLGNGDGTFTTRATIQVATIPVP